VCLETRWLGPKTSFYVLDQYCSWHHLQLKALDCVAAYLQAELNLLYVYPPNGLMQEIGQDLNKIWKLNKALYSWAPLNRILFDKVSIWLHNYGFRTLGNSGTFMMLDRRDLPGYAGGIIFLHDGLGSTDNSALWDSFMVDFKAAFNVLEKTQTISSDVPLSRILSLVLSSLTRENNCAQLSPNDMTVIHSFPIPLPAVRRINTNGNWNGDEDLRNLYQQIAGSLNLEVNGPTNGEEWSQHTCNYRHQSTNQPTGRLVTVNIDGRFGSTYGRTRSILTIGSLTPTDNYGLSSIVDNRLR